MTRSIVLSRRQAVAAASHASAVVATPAPRAVLATIAALAALSALVLLLVPSRAEAQKPAVARLTPYVGYMTFGDYVDGPIGTRISNSNSALYGVSAGLDLSPQLSLVGNVGYTDSNVRVGLPIIGGVNIADSKVLLYDGGLQFRLGQPSSLGAGIVPFVEVGAGAIRYEVRTGPLATNATNFAGNFGGGIDLHLNRSIALRGAVKDYVGKFDFREATSFDLNSKVSHNVAFTVGLTLGF
ncbi:MAG TPA: outer membrane beta-barrel protein [Gemmatimonadaceae bacterium]|nr:outer membrane beta-barrel protein [Gemmatimonadaceae bacterium]